MKAITLRNLPPDVAKAVKQKARREGRSLNRAIIRLLEETTGGSGSPREWATLVLRCAPDLTWPGSIRE